RNGRSSMRPSLVLPGSWSGIRLSIRDNIVIAVSDILDLCHHMCEGAFVIPALADLIFAFLPHCPPLLRMLDVPTQRGLDRVRIVRIAGVAIAWLDKCRNPVRQIGDEERQAACHVIKRLIGSTHHML